MEYYGKNRRQVRLSQHDAQGHFRLQESQCFSLPHYANRLLPYDFHGEWATTNKEKMEQENAKSRRKQNEQGARGAASSKGEHDDQ